MRRDEGEPQQRGSLSEAALHYARDGWFVFPLFGKAPLKGSNGHRDATKDVEQIQAWGNTNVPIVPAPQWFLEALTREKSRQERTLQEGGLAQVAGGKWLREAVEKAREGNRNQIGFHLACQLRDDGLSQTEAENIMLSY